ncbi:hypothetical protein, partial [Allomesorhizobium alhagi]
CPRPRAALGAPGLRRKLTFRRRLASPAIVLIAGGLVQRGTMMDLTFKGIPQPIRLIDSGISSH